ncbi:MAG TPA: TadE/TadG family type IV pilus assembly protein [Candidatus Limnocylindrales bacterium]|nr:TadE/TadG family type IV pilus assembly protein [Candidatus Limnocylindrales bacterium]
MRTSSKSHARYSRGQALTEFALVAPLFFLMLFAIIEGGRFVFYYEVLNNATREGARYAIVNGANTIGCSTGPPLPGTSSCDPTGQDVIDRVRSSAFAMPAAAINVVPTWHDPATNRRGSTITVVASYTYSSLIPIVPLPPITVQAESSLVINN